MYPETLRPSAALVTAAVTCTGVYDPETLNIPVQPWSFGNSDRIPVCLSQGLPRNGQAGSAALYGAILVTMGLLKVWAAPACNNPVFAEIVPPHMRNMIYAFDRCFEGAVAACATPFVGMLAQRMFGFTVSTDSPANDSLRFWGAGLLGGLEASVGWLSGVRCACDSGWRFEQGRLGHGCAFGPGGMGVHGGGGREEVRSIASRVGNGLRQVVMGCVDDQCVCLGVTWG